MTEFSEWLTTTMKVRKTSQRAVGRACGVYPTTVADWMAGAYRPGFDHCVQIAKLLRVDDSLVLALAGHPSVPEGEPIAEATLSPLEATILRAYRGATDRGRQVLLGLAEELIEIQAARGEPAAEAPGDPQNLPGPA